MTPDELRKKAAELDAKAEAALERGDKEAWERLIRQSWAASDLADERERMAREGRGRLPVRDQRGNKKTMVNPARVRISAGADANPDELVAKANAAGYTLRSLAEAVKCSHALLSQARRGERTISRAITERIEALIGFRATKANWPRLRD